MPRLTKHSILTRGIAPFELELLPKSQVGKVSSYTLDLGPVAQDMGLFQQCEVTLESNPATGPKPASHYTTVRIYGASTDATTNQQVKNGQMATLKISAVIAPQFGDHAKQMIVNVLDSLTADTTELRTDWNSASNSKQSPLCENIITNANQY